MFCPKCGKSIDANADFCQECGYKIAKKQQEQLNNVSNGTKELIASQQTTNETFSEKLNKNNPVKPFAHKVIYNMKEFIGKYKK